MQELVHRSVERIEEMLQMLTHVQSLYLQESFELDQELDKLLVSTAAFFDEKGNVSRKAELLNSRSRIYTVKKAFHPFTFEKISTDRRVFIRGFSFTALENLFKILDTLYLEESAKIEDGEQILGKLLISLYQNTILDRVALSKLTNTQEIQDFWEQLSLKNKSIDAIDKQLKLSLSAGDIYLLLEKILAKMET